MSELNLNQFLTAIVEGNEAVVNEMTPQITDMMVDYVRIKYRADSDDANDCAQDTLISLIEKLQEDQEVPDNPGAYIRTSLRNYYFRIFNKNKTKTGDEVLQFHDSGDNPVAELLDNEMIRLLKLCIEKLDELQKKLIRYCLSNPDVRADEVALRFDLTKNNVWVRRHRIHKQLQECIEKKI